jgi:hypothetical protein
MLVPEMMAVNRLPVRLTLKLADGRVYLLDPALLATPPTTTPTTGATTAQTTTPARE